jgi:glycosyltransferase involved in cell wall biosynthesis
VTGDVNDPASLQWNRRALRRLLSDFRPDVVQIEEEPGSPATAAASAEASHLGIPVVLFSWESLPRRRGFWERRRMATSLRAAKGAIGGNALAAALLRESLGALPVVTLPQAGIAPPPPSSRPGHPGLAIGFVGRLLPERGVEDLLRACATIMGPWSLTVAGTGPEQESLEALAQRLGLASRIKWMGGVSRAEITGLWPALDCLVFPSRPTPTWTERWSPVLVDAMAHGVIPVVTAAGGLTDVVEGAGVVVGDVEALGEALQRLLAFPEERQAGSAAARQRVLERYVDTALAQQTLALWRQVVAARAPLNRSA